MLKVVKKSKIIVLIIVFIMTTVIISNNVYATDSIIQGAKDFLDAGTESTLDSAKIKSASDKIYNTFMAVGFVIVLIVGAILGIQFIMGSVEEKAKIQESLIPYIIGTVIIFGSFGIWRLAITIAEPIFDKGILGGSTSGGSTSGGSTSGGSTSGGSTSGGSTSGGSTTHESSSGRTHGGGGGKF